MNKPTLILSLGLALCAPTLNADVKLPAIFGDNMVLQQGREAQVWGKADPGEKVTVSVAGQSASAVADSSGNWKLTLKPLKTDAKQTTVTVTGKNTITLQNVLVGEVWVGSGQSNMQWGVRAANDAEKEIAAAKYPTLRLFTVERYGWPQALEDVKGKWVECSPETVKEFSATLYFFGRDLQAQIQQPIGLINSSVGGTIVQSWTRWEVLLTDPQTKAQAEERVKELDNPEWVARKFAADTARYAEAERKAKAEGKPMRGPKPEWLGPWYRNRPAGLYNAMIHPLLGFPIRGVVWYQGEFNASDPDQYARMFPKMIQDWRQQWGLGEFPFFFVQLPGNNEMQTEPANTKQSWALQREAQSKALALPNTGMAVTIDTAPEGDLHPKNKQPVGNRLARIAAAKVYGKSIAFEAPTFESMSKEGSALRLKFRHAKAGLITRDGSPVRGFAIAGADQKFVWADARIEGETVVVSNAAVSDPVAVRYGWANNPVISLFNKEGLPLAPFRTDDWK